MRTSLKAAAAGTVATMVMGGAVLTGTTGAQAAEGRQIAGTWAVQVDPSGPPPPFASTIVYTSTGSVVETTMNRRPDLTATMTTGLGTWERLGDGRFATTFSKYRFNSTGEFLGTTVVREVSEVSPDGESYSAQATAEVRDTSGAVVTTLYSTAQGTRQ